MQKKNGKTAAAAAADAGEDAGAALLLLPLRLLWRCDREKFLHRSSKRFCCWFFLAFLMQLVELLLLLLFFLVRLLLPLQVKGFSPQQGYHCSKKTCSVFCSVQIGERGKKSCTLTKKQTIRRNANNFNDEIPPLSVRAEGNSGVSWRMHMKERAVVETSVYWWMKVNKNGIPWSNYQIISVDSSGFRLE